MTKLLSHYGSRPAARARETGAHCVPKARWTRPELYAIAHCAAASQQLTNRTLSEIECSPRYRRLDSLRHSELPPPRHIERAHRLFAVWLQTKLYGRDEKTMTTT